MSTHDQPHDQPQAEQRAPSEGAAGARCAATAKSGAPCSHAAEEGSAWCFWHDPAREAERREVLSQRGRAGREKRAVAERARRGEVLTLARLETAEQVRGAIERALTEVEACNAPACVRANAVARLAGVALDIIKTNEMENELEELRALVCERWPEARNKLGRGMA